MVTSLADDGHRSFWMAVVNAPSSLCSSSKGKRKGEGEGEREGGGEVQGIGALRIRCAQRHVWLFFLVLGLEGLPTCRFTQAKDLQKDIFQAGKKALVEACSTDHPAVTLVVSRIGLEPSGGHPQLSIKEWPGM